jgi:RNA polymerase sigma-70 factor (ECF subfamily)
MGSNDMRQELTNLGNGAHALAIQILGNADDAADAVHDAFATALSRPNAYDQKKGPFKPWFLRVVRNRCIDLLRKRRAAGQPVEELVDPGIAPERRLEILQRDQQLEKALTKISAEKRQLLVLRDYLDLSYAQIADVLNVAPGTVMSRLHRARLSLKEALERDDG